MTTCTPSIVALSGIAEKSNPCALRTYVWSPASNVAAVTLASPAPKMLFGLTQAPPAQGLSDPLCPAVGPFGPVVDTNPPASSAKTYMRTAPCKYPCKKSWYRGVAESATRLCLALPTRQGHAQLPRSLWRGYPPRWNLCSQRATLNRRAESGVRPTTSLL